MIEYLRLYRGDSAKINKFCMYMTSSNSLLGQGIYLTDNEKIAQSYRTKSSGPGSTLLLSKDLNNMDEARQEALVGYVKYMLMRNGDFKIANSEKKLAEVSSLYKADFERILEERDLIIQRLPSKTLGKKFHFFAYYFPPDVGYVTAFDFPKKYLENNIVNLETRKYDQGLLEVAWECRCFVDKITYIRGDKERTESQIVLDDYSRVKEYVHMLGVTPGLFKHDRLRNVLHREYGIHGFEYKGGIRVGGLGSHRAFSLWDDNLVNQNKVKRYQ